METMTRVIMAAWIGCAIGCGADRLDREDAAPWPVDDLEEKAAVPSELKPELTLEPEPRRSGSSRCLNKGLSRPTRGPPAKGPSCSCSSTAAR